MSRRRGKKVGLHHHRCTRCGCRYDDTCQAQVTGKRGGIKTEPGPDTLCPACATGNPNPWWYEGRLPAPCCAVNVRSVRREELEIYRLAGAAEWWICTTCFRAHPFDPRRNT